MNKAQLVETLSTDFGFTKTDVEILLDGLIVTIMYAGARGERVTIRDFGTFTIKVRKARKGRNPRTGEVINIPEVIAPKFVPSQNFREYVK